MTRLTKILATTGVALAGMLVSPAVAAAGSSGIEPQAWEHVGGYSSYQECIAAGEAGLAAGKWRDYRCMFWVGWHLRADVI